MASHSNISISAKMSELVLLVHGLLVDLSDMAKDACLTGAAYKQGLLIHGT